MPHHDREGRGPWGEQKVIDATREAKRRVKGARDLAAPEREDGPRARKVRPAMLPSDIAGLVSNTLGDLTAGVAQEIGPLD